jgi:hypothetical protein
MKLSDGQPPRFMRLKRISFLVFAAGACLLLSLMPGASPGKTVGAPAQIAAVAAGPTAIPNESPLSRTQTPAQSADNPVENDDDDAPEPSAAATNAPVLWSLEALNNELKTFGRVTIAGMPPREYDSAMAIEWMPLNTIGPPQPLQVNLRNLMGYADIESIIFNLDRYDGVDAFDIGDSEQSRNIYMVKIDLKGVHSPAEKPMILLTGSVHAREFAGADYLCKMMNDLMIQAQTDAYTQRLLEQITIVCVPLVNPDGRELIIESGKNSRKSNANGVDLNRNMPSLNAGMHKKGVRFVELISKKPGMYYFPGDYLGSESESRAMIRFFNTYIPDPNTKLYVDMHQFGQFTYYNKPFLSIESDLRSRAFGIDLRAVLNKGYPLRKEKATYGLDGAGGTMTDYARSVAEGMVFSYKYGRLVMMAEGVETPLLQFSDIDKAPTAHKPANPDFVAVTMEIGTVNSVGMSKSAHNSRFRTYNKYGWANFLPGIAELVLGQSD